MGKAVSEAALSAGLHLIPVSFSSSEDIVQTIQVGGKDIQVHGPSERESILSSIFDDYPDLIVVDYTVPAAVNGKKFISWILLSGAGKRIPNGILGNLRIRGKTRYKRVRVRYDEKVSFKFN